MLVKNVISKGVYGIHLASSSNHNTITENVVDLCSSNGVDMTYSDSNQITKNKVNSSTNCGIRMHLSDSNIVADNSFNDNKYGIFTYRSHNNVLTNNMASICWLRATITRLQTTPLRTTTMASSWILQATTGSTIDLLQNSQQMEETGTTPYPPLRFSGTSNDNSTTHMKSTLLYH